MTSRKPRGYWKHYENVQRELQVVTSQLGHFPSGPQLVNLGQSGLLTAITNYYGGLEAIRKRFGYDPQKKPRGYWQDFGNVERELSEVERKLGHFPSSEDLKKMKQGSLAVAIFTYHGGINAVRERLGKEGGVKSPGYWQDGLVVHQELTKIIEELGHFPTVTQ